MACLIKDLCEYVLYRDRERERDRLLCTPNDLLRFIVVVVSANHRLIKRPINVGRKNLKIGKLL